ncbi:MAG: hypothetical protein JJLCMIEE_01829 [Acidimicrobiales bacterium]|nr:hypothetical protein [Acidimicrobiales bacterium]
MRASTLVPMVSALVLNASQEPLSVVPTRRALLLVLADKADVLHHNGEVVRSERLTIHMPSVVRLRYYVRVPFRRGAALNRRTVFLRDRHTCQYCGSTAESIDHVVPRSRGGSHSWDNVVAACRRCNTRKRDRLLVEAGMRLHRTPREPDRLSWVSASVGSVPTHWEPYLGLSSLSA